MQNDKIKEYWEGEAGIYSEGIKAELKSETAENWKNLILEYAPEKEHLEDSGYGRDDIWLSRHDDAGIRRR